MKKSIIALAVVASMAAQADSTTLYGSVRMAYQYSDAADLSQSRLGAGNFGSRFGIKGEDDLGNGMTAFYKYENRISDQKNAGGSLTTNKLYVGLKGGFGSFSIGTQNLPNDSLTNYSDPFNNYTPELRLVGTSSTNSLVYWSPDMSGFQIGAAIVSDGNELPGFYDDNHADRYQIVAKYEANGIYAGLGYDATNNLGTNTDVNTVTLGLGYGNDAFGIGLVADFHDIDASDSNPVWARLAGHYNITAADQVYAGVSMLDTDVTNVDTAYQGTIGYQHKFSARTKVWTEYSYTDAGSSAAEYNQFAVGLRTDF